MNDKIYKYFDNELSHAEKLELFKNINEDSELKAEFIKLQNISAISKLSINTNKSEGLNKFFEFSNKIKREKLRRNLFDKIKIITAAAATISFIFFSSMYFINKSGKHIAYSTISVPAGQRIELKLNDNTKVWLNSNSKIIYPANFDVKERRVSIEGEAFFEVSKNKNKPFIVTAQNVDIKVTGTKFNVNNDTKHETVTTSLIEGSVKVFVKGNEHAGVILKPNQQITITKGKKTIEDIPNKSHFLWRNGLLSFNNESLYNIINSLKEMYGVQIYIDGNKDFFKNMKFTGKLRQIDGIFEILRILKQMYKFDIKADMENYTFKVYSK